MSDGEYVTTTACAKALRVSGEFIRGEIKDGRLHARVFRRGRRNVYRIAAEDFTDYVERYWPTSTTHSFP